MSLVNFEVKENVGIIRLNRPEKLNSFNREMSIQLQDVLDECKPASIRCVYLTGEGKGFSAGQDLAEVTDPDGVGMKRILSEHFNPIVMRIRRLDKPVVAAVNGVAAGAGANIALGCDIVVAAESASFIQAFSKIGLVPDSGGTYILPRLIGWQKASALMMLGEKVSATDAERMGMLYKVFPDDVFAEASWAIAVGLSKMPTKGLALTKQLLQISVNSCLPDQIAEEDVFQQRAADTADFKEGIAAFIEKRLPNFRGK
ncbi:MAG: enoyl-CoA hydratase/isomerase family protein [Chitinophagaceae bacterium]|nr:enoyl-CoA hydratase/isomerase family protein [Chitinophagaceae bacterium]